MATINLSNYLPASHSQNARRSQRVYADVQVVNEGDADGFAELVLFGDLDGSSGVQEVRRGGGGAFLKAYSNYISGGGPYRVSAVVFEIVNGQRQTVLAQHDNFTANIVVRAGSGGWMSQEEADAEAAAAAQQARIEAEERARIERQNREREAAAERARLEAEQRERERWQTEEDYWEAPDPVIDDPVIDEEPDEGEYFFEIESEPVAEFFEPVVEVEEAVAEPWQTEESDWVEPEPEPFVEPDWWRWEE